MANDDVSLARLDNNNWFLKGESSEAITLWAYNILQASYMVRANNLNELDNYLDPNILIPLKSFTSLKFPKYHFVMQALGAEHGLIPHNRKFYFNVFQNVFEPVYYDGNVLGKSDLAITMERFGFSQQIIMHAYNNELNVENYSSYVISEEIKRKSKNFFNKRTNLSVKESSILFERYWRIFISRNNTLKKLIGEKRTLEKYEESKDYQLEVFLKRASKNSLIEVLGLELKKNRDQTFSLSLSDGQFQSINAEELAEILSKNSFNGTRTTLLNVDVDRSAKSPKFRWKIIFSSGINLILMKKSHNFEGQKRPLIGFFKTYI